MTDFSKFGLSVSRKHVMDSVEATIKAFEEDYLSEAERQWGLNPHDLPTFKTHSQVNEFRNWADDETPVCVIVSPGLAGRPEKKGSGLYMGKFDLGVACIVQANNRENTNRLADIYGPAIRQLLLQQIGFGGLISGIDFVDEKANDVPESEDRAQTAVQVIFTVDVPGIVNGRLGIAAPSEDPYGEDLEKPDEQSEAAVAEKATATVEKKDEVEP
jgi:hypothetical protein